MMFAITYIVIMVVTCYSGAELLGHCFLGKWIGLLDIENRCHFTKETVNNNLKEDTHFNHCQPKCRVDILGDYDSFYDDYTYYVKELQLTIGSSKFTYSICSHYGWKRSTILSINCSWIQENVTVGNPCVSDWQCSGTQFSSVCTHGFCECQPGYLFFNRFCLPEDLPLNSSCQIHEQCTHSPHALCVKGKCTCIEGYSSYGKRCMQDNVVVGGPCLYKEQCKGTENSEVCQNGMCACETGYFSINEHCYEDNVVLGGPCMYKEQCKGTENSKVCKNGLCACETGYISINEHCYEGNVSLDNQCFFHAQCSGSPNASCRDGNCTCIEGYVPDKSSKCILSPQTNDKEAFGGDQRESSLGGTLGALFGGVFLGVLITGVIGLIIYKRSQQNFKTRQKEEPTVVFAENNAYGNARIQGNADNASTNNKNNQRKIVNVPPYAPSDESPEYGNVSQTSRTKRVNEDIYNHLNEKETPDDDDNYDHACAATGHTRGNFDSDYSSMRDVDKGYGSLVAKGTDDYFTLEKN